MWTISLGRWSNASGVFFTRRRLFTRSDYFGHKRIHQKGHGWTPFCRIRRRYDNWLGYWRGNTTSQ